MKLKTYIATANAAGTGFALQVGEEIGLGPELAKDLMRAGYVWPNSKGLTVEEAKRKAAAHRAKVLADAGALAASEPVSDPDADPAADPDADPAADPAADPDADPDADPAAEDETQTPAG